MIAEADPLFSIVYLCWTFQKSHRRVRDCLQHLKILLGNKTYFFGNEKPSSLDAVAFGYLACLAFPQLPDNSLKEMIYEYPSLVTFCEKIARQYFEQDYKPVLTVPRER